MGAAPGGLLVHSGVPPPGHPFPALPVSDPDDGNLIPHTLMYKCSPVSVRQLCLAQTTSFEVSDISSLRPESALGLGPWDTLLFLPDPYSSPSQMFHIRAAVYRWAGCALHNSAWLQKQKGKKSSWCVPGLVPPSRMDMSKEEAFFSTVCLWANSPVGPTV